MGVKCGVRGVWGVVWGWGSRPWVGGGRCPGSCSECTWLSWSGWLPQFSSARTLWLFLGLWCLPSWCSDWSFEHELQYRSWGLLVSPLSVFTQPDFQHPLSFSHIHLWAIHTGDLVHHSCLFLLSSLFRVLFGLKTGFSPRGGTDLCYHCLAPWCILGGSFSCCGFEVSGRGDGWWLGAWGTEHATSAIPQRCNRKWTTWIRCSRRMGSQRSWWRRP